MEAAMVLFGLKQCEEQDVRRQLERSRPARVLRSAQPALGLSLGTRGRVRILSNALCAHGQKIVGRIKAKKRIKAASW